jgi:hypothetical protein
VSTWVHAERGEYIRQSDGVNLRFTDTRARKQCENGKWKRRGLLDQIRKFVRIATGRAEGTSHLRHHFNRLAMLVLLNVPIRFLDAHIEHKEVLSQILRQRLHLSRERGEGRLR